MNVLGMRWSRPGGMIVLLACVVGIAGCAGGKSNASVEARTTTAGQELQDLNEAHEKGLISDREYERMRSEIVRRESGGGCGGTGLEAAPLLAWLLWRKRTGCHGAPGRFGTATYRRRL